MAPRAPLPPAGECLGGLSVGAGQQPLASVRPGQIHVTIHTHTHTHTHTHAQTNSPSPPGSGMLPNINKTVPCCGPQSQVRPRVGTVIVPEGRATDVDLGASAGSADRGCRPVCRPGRHRWGYLVRGTPAEGHNRRGEWGPQGDRFVDVGKHPGSGMLPNINSRIWL